MTRYSWRPLFLLSLLLCAGTQASASEADISVRAELSRASITIGDPVEYTVTIRHDPSIRILSTIPAPSSDIFEVRTIREFSDQAGGMEIRGRKFVLTAFRLGEYILEPLKIEYRDGEGERHTIETSRLFLTVRSVAGGEPQHDIRDIKSVMALAIERWWLWLLVLLAVLFILGIFFWARRSQNNEKPVKAPAPKLSPEDEALVELNKLTDSDLLRRGLIKDYFFRLSEILRVYLERRYNIMAVESTTFEIDRLLKDVDISKDARQKAMEVLEASDLAKFAKWRPDPVEITSLTKQAKNVVEMARRTGREELPSGV